MRKISLVLCVAGSALTGACASNNNPGWTGAGEPFGPAEAACRQEAERAPSAEHRTAFEACMEKRGWRPLSR